MAKNKTTKKSNTSKVSAKSKSTKKALKAIGAEMSGVPKVKRVTKTKVEKAIAATVIAPVQEVVEQVVAIPDVLLLASGHVQHHVPVVETKTTASKAAAHTPRTLAAKRAADLVRYLKIHARKPYGPRGESAIARLAVEVGHLAHLELGDAQEGVMKQT